jgi:putative addiction module CopG family antidote
MKTINISLPDQMKQHAESLIKDGYYASFSDLVRTALRNIISMDKHDRMATQAMDEHRKGKTTILQSPKDVDTYVNSILEKAKG